MKHRFNRLAATAALLAAAVVASTGARAEYTFTYIMHSDTSSPFWGVVNRGMQDACDTLEVSCQMVTLRNDGDAQEELTNLQTAISQNVDGIVTTIINKDIFDETIQQGLDAGIPIIASTSDDEEGAAGTPRLAFIGQDLEQAGYDLAEDLSRSFPDGNVHVLIGLPDIAAGWATQRAAGMERFMEDYKTANPNRDVTWERIETTYDNATVATRVGAYLQAHPETTAYIDVGVWNIPVAKALRDLGREPGEVLVGGFDLLPEILKEMENGYIQVTVDQQPYLQGYLSILQLYLMNKFGLSAWDVNTGRALVHPEDVPTVKEFANKGYR